MGNTICMSDEEIHKMYVERLLTAADGQINEEGIEELVMTTQCNLVGSVFIYIYIYI